MHQQTTYLLHLIGKTMTLQLTDKQQVILYRLVEQELLTLEEVAFVEGRPYTDTEVLRNLEDMRDCLIPNHLKRCNA